MLVFPLPSSHPCSPLVKDPFLPLGSADESLAKFRKNALNLHLSIEVSAWQKACVPKSLLCFPAFPVSLVKENLMSVYKICLVSICIPSQLLQYQHRAVNFNLFAIYLARITKRLNHCSDSSKLERRNAGLDITVVELAGFYKGELYTVSLITWRRRESMLGEYPQSEKQPERVYQAPWWR